MLSLISEVELAGINAQSLAAFGRQRRYNLFMWRARSSRHFSDSSPQGGFESEPPLSSLSFDTCWKVQERLALSSNFAEYFEAEKTIRDEIETG